MYAIIIQKLDQEITNANKNENLCYDLLQVKN